VVNTEIFLKKKRKNLLYYNSVAAHPYLSDRELVWVPSFMRCAQAGTILDVYSTIHRKKM
jgi:hypothetical protein